MASAGSSNDHEAVLSEQGLVSQSWGDLGTAGHRAGLLGLLLACLPHVERAEMRSLVFWCYMGGYGATGRVSQTCRFLRNITSMWCQDCNTQVLSRFRRLDVPPSIGLCPLRRVVDDNLLCWNCRFPTPSLSSRDLRELNGTLRIRTVFCPWRGRVEETDSEASWDS